MEIYFYSFVTSYPFIFYQGHRSQNGAKFKNLNLFINLQISFDLTLLIYLVHFTGGAENPLIFFSVFHIIIVNVLLSRSSAYLQAAFVIVLFGTMVLTEYLQILPHYHITELIPTELYRSPLYLIGMVSVFGSTVILAAYFATYISNKLKERGERVAYYQERLNRELDLKSQYITTVSHGIEAPLSAIQSCLKVVLDGRTGPISEKSRDMIARAEGRCTFALHFVKDPLNLAKIRGAKRLTVSSVSLRNVLKEVLDQLDKRIKEKGIVLELKIANGDHTLLASQYAMEQVFSNLLANAIKYTPYGGEVVVEVKEEVNEYRIHVCDTGIGIPRRTSHIYFETSIGQRMLNRLNQMALVLVSQRSNR